MEGAQQPPPFAEAALAFSWVVFSFELYLTFRQYRKYGERAMPRALEGIIDHDTFERARVYGLDKARFSLCSDLYGQLEGTAVLVLGALPWVWRQCAIALTAAGWDPAEHTTIHALAFLLFAAAAETLIRLPWGAYYRFVIEARHGFNKQSVRGWLWDKTKGFVIAVVIMLPVAALFLTIIESGGPHFYVYAWLFLLCVSLAAVTVFPYIAALFDRYDPLPDGPLKDRIVELARGIAFPLGRILVVDASRKSSHSNAFFYGFFGNKRIVLFDTLLPEDRRPPRPEGTPAPTADAKPGTEQHCTDDEILAVLAHELGHWRLSHTLKNFILGQAHMFASLFVFGRLMHSPDLFASFGFPDERPTLVGLIIIFAYVFSPVDLVLSFLLTVLSRRFEFQADAFAARLGHGAPLRTALIRLQASNLGNMNPDRLYSAYHYSHPTLVERLAAIDRLTRKAQ